MQPRQRTMHAVTELEGYRVRPAEVTVLAPGRLSVTIHEGRNRQVRRLCALAGLRVRRLVRVAEGELRPRHARAAPVAAADGAGDRIPEISPLRRKSLCKFFS